MYKTWKITYLGYEGNLHTYEYTGTFDQLACAHLPNGDRDRVTKVEVVPVKDN